MSIIVTGASGNYGRATVQGLLERVPAEDLILMTRTPDKLAAFAERGCKVRRGDFDEPDSLREVFQGGDVMMLISTARVGKRVVQHAAAIDAAVAVGVKRIAYTSFVGLGPQNPAIVARDHEATEELLRRSGAAWTFLRDNQYADAMVFAAAPAGLASGRWPSSTGDGRIGFVTRQNCVDVAVAVLSGAGHENQAYDVTGPELLSIREVCQIVSDIAGRPIEYVPVTDDDMYAHFDSLGVPREPVDDQIVNNIPWCSDDMVTFEAAVRGGHLAVLSDAVERLTGRAPESFRHFAERNAEFLRSIPRAAA